MSFIHNFIMLYFNTIKMIMDILSKEKHGFGYLNT